MNPEGDTQARAQSVSAQNNLTGGRETYLDRLVDTSVNQAFLRYQLISEPFEVAARNDPGAVAAMLGSDFEIEDTGKVS